VHDESTWPTSDHKDLSTTQAAYQHIDAEEHRQRLEQELDEIGR
jgi:hypothetical protein